MSGLVKQTMSLPTALGIDSKTAPALVDKSKFLAMQNARFVKGVNGEIQKRNGYYALNDKNYPGATLTNGQSLISFGTEQDLIANSELYAYAEYEGVWMGRGNVINIVPTETTIVDNAYIQSVPDALTYPGFGITVYAWEDTRGGVWYKVIDESTNAVLVGDTQFLSTGVMPRIVQNGVNLSIFCSSTGGGIWMGNIDVLSPLVIPNPTEVVTALASTAFEILYNSSTTNYAIAYNNTSSRLTISNFDGSFTPSNTTVYGVGYAAIAVAMVAYSGGLYVTWMENGGSYYLYAIVVAQDTVSTVNYARTAEDIGFPCQTLCCYNQNGTTLRILIQFPPTASNGITDTWIYNCEYTNSSFVNITLMASGLGICSLPILIGSAYYFLANFISSVQQTYFLTNAITGNCIGRFMYSDAGPFPAQPRLAQWSNPPSDGDGDIWFVPVAEANVVLTSAGGLTTYLYGITKLALDLGQSAVRSDVLGEDLSICGALPQIYDGTNLVEQGFNQYPEQMTAAIVSTNLALTNITRQASTNLCLSFTLSFAVNPVAPGSDGVMLIPGDYALLGQGYGVYWNVNNATPSAPTTGPYSGVTWEVIPVNTTDSASVIAAKTWAVINPLLTNYTTTVVGNTITFTPISTATANAFTKSQPYCTVSTPGNSGTEMSIGFSCLPGYSIQPGQYIFFQAYHANNSQLTNQYLWFTVNGVGTDPNPLNAGWYGLKVAILSTDTERQVATKIAAAINAAPSTFYVTVTATQSVITIVGNYDGGISTNPSVANIGANAIGLTTSGSASYQYVAVYEWVDAKGQLHRSAPSVPVSVYVGGFGLQLGVIQLTVKPLRLSYKTNVDIAIYRTAGNGTIFQRVTSSANLFYNQASFAGNSSVDSQTYTDNVSDTALASGEFLYTTGGVVQNDQAPAMLQVHSHLDRLWAVGLENPQLIWWSKFFSSGVAVEWSALQTTTIDAGAGPVLKLMTMDSNLIVFCANEIWLIAGSGPTAANQGTPFSSPQQITSPVSIRDPQSAVLIPEGIIFKSAKGFYLLDRSLNVSQAGINGTDVESFVADVVTAATIVPGTTEVRFLVASGGTTLLYDYQFKQWCPFTDHYGVDAAVFQGTYYYLNATGGIAIVNQEAPGYYVDPQYGAISMKLQTAWIKSTGDNQAQAFARVWQTLLKGNFPAGCQLQVQLAVNYNSTPVDTQVFNNPGSTVPQLRFKHIIQRCESFQLTIQDLNPDGSGVLAYSLDALDFEVGIKKGGFKDISSGNTL
jgi:hypothetical protein